MFEMKVTTDIKISELKKKISEKTDIKFGDYILSYEGDTLESSHTLKHYQFEEGNTVDVVRSIDEEIVIDVKDLNNKTYPIEISPNDTFSTLRKMICDKAKVDLDDIIISANGKSISQQKDGQTLDELNFHDHQLVVVVRRFIGGRFT